MEFAFFLADRLHMTHARLVSEMSNAEFVQWSMWHARKAQRREMDQLKAKRKGR